MEIEDNSAVYDELHEGLLRGLFASVFATLKQAAEYESIQVGDEYLEGVVEDIVFGVAAVVDGSAVMEFNGREVHPYLVFRESRESETLIKNDVGSYLHEMVMGYLDDHDAEDL